MFCVKSARVLLFIVYLSILFTRLGTYQGQWLRGLRHGYGVRTSAPFGMASRFRPKSIRSSMTSLRSDAATGHHGGHHGAVGASGGGGGAGADPAADRDKRLDDGRGGFVLKSRSDEPPTRRRSFSERSSTIKKTLFQVKSSFIFSLSQEMIWNAGYYCCGDVCVAAGSALEEAAQHGRIGEEGDVGVDPLHGQLGFLDVHRVVAVGTHGRLSPHRLQRLFHCRGKTQISATFGSPIHLLENDHIKEIHVKLFYTDERTRVDSVTCRLVDQQFRSNRPLQVGEPSGSSNE